MKSGHLELKYAVDVDEYGCFNGVELAGEMIAYAAILLAPYVNNCPGCLNTLFGAVANPALERIHGDLRDGFVYTDLMYSGPLESREANEKAHLNAMDPLICALLKGEEHLH